MATLSRSKSLDAFQPTRPRGARRGSPGPRATNAGVSTHAPTRGATPAEVRRRAVDYLFQPTRPRGARRPAAWELTAAGKVSTHAPTRGATPATGPWWWPAWRFNPRAHAGRDLGQRPADKALSVSTHAPTRGATAGRRHPSHGRAVSTHAPTRGATWRPSSSATRKRSFQPTRPRGARPDVVCDESGTPSCFNPRAHAGRDGIAYRHGPVTSTFQPTRPRGARHGIFCGPHSFIEVSTHAPTRGATAGRLFYGQLSGVSTHAPTRGATCCGMPFGVSTVFQPTRPRGARR